jgi:acyl-coenzyme A synthetase/AMP-(fatty) acid ligase
MGYWDDLEATSRRFRPNPLRPPGTPPSERVVYSGDDVYYDDDGDLYFVGRDDAMIKTMGHRVSPDEISDALFASGQILEAVVTSEPDEVRGARIVAYVVYAADGGSERLQRFIQRELPRHMQPARIERRTQLARTASGKYDVAATVESAP